MVGRSHDICQQWELAGDYKYREQAVSSSWYITQVPSSGNFLNFPCTWNSLCQQLKHVIASTNHWELPVPKYLELVCFSCVLARSLMHAKHYYPHGCGVLQVVRILPWQDEGVGSHSSHSLVTGHVFFLFLLGGWGGGRSKQFNS